MYEGWGDHLGPMIYVDEILYMKSWVNHLWLVVRVYIGFYDDMRLCLTKKEGKMTVGGGAEVGHD